jgi:hypothetical protein
VLLQHDRREGAPGHPPVGVRRLRDVHGRPQPVGQPTAGVVGEQQDGQGKPVGEQSDHPAHAVGDREHAHTGDDPRE